MRRYVYNVDKKSADATTTSNEVVTFDDHDRLLAVAWVGEHGKNYEVAIKTHDGRIPIVDQVSVDYYKMGAGREEMILNQNIQNNQIRLETSFETGADVKGQFIFTVEKN